MTSDEHMTLDAAARREPRRRTIAITSRGAPAELAALDFGDPARPIDVVFLHANGFNAMTYRSVLAPLADQLRILAVDQQGHGHSPQRGPAEGRVNWLDFRDDLLGLLSALGGPPAVLAGHSMGGAVSILAAAERPAAVRGLALFDPVIAPRDLVIAARGLTEPSHADNPLAVGARRRRAHFPSRADAIASYTGRGAFKTWPAQALADYVEDGFKDRPDGEVELTCAPEWESSNFSAHLNDVWTALEGLRTPVSILRAEFGSTCNLTSAETYLAANPDFRVETVAGATHFLPLERPDLVAATLTERVG
jgi:pimeloyl-ACP methyl ester carboxylesterase